MHFDETTNEYVFSPDQARQIGLEFEPASPEVRRPVEYTRQLLAKADILAAEAAGINYENEDPGTTRAVLKHRQDNLLWVSAQLCRLVAPQLPPEVLEAIPADFEAYLQRLDSNSN